ncbi:MAG: ATP-dependent DNA helicase [Oceanococcus sp.]
MSEIEEVLGAEGALAGVIPGFATRSGQIQLAEQVLRSLLSGDALIAEAGTGIGKTFAYLVPAIISEKRVLISTGTRHLQDQLYHSDIPRLTQALGIPNRAQLLKGRSNYFCIHRAGKFIPQHAADADKIKRVQSWSVQTDTGDLAELPDLRDQDPIRQHITSNAENCLGAQCPEYEGCFVARARSKAQQAQIVVVNHHLLCADLALKEDGFGELLPEMEAVIIDEAHQFPDVLAQFFGFGVSARQCRDLGRDIIDAANAFGDIPELKDQVAAMGDALQHLLGCFPFSRQRLEMDDLMSNPDFVAELETLNDVIGLLYKTLEVHAGRGPELSTAWRRVGGLLTRIRRWRTAGQQDVTAPDPAGEVDELVRWAERHSNGFSLQAIPMDVVPAMNTARSRQTGAWIMTSATLSVAGQFAHFTERLGLTDAQTLNIESPFDYAKNARLLLPQGLPAPNDRAYPKALTELGKRLIESSGGGCFWLCTSQRAVEEYARSLRQWGHFKVLEQGEQERSQLLENFRLDGHAILVGTSSFWEGVDVRGDALRLVIIDRLPFVSPEDPLIKARSLQLTKEGRNPFFDFQVPQAVLTLKQGAGRLIRDVSDRGLLVLGDSRVQKMRYGRNFLESLPPMTVIRDESEASAFLQDIRA